MSQELCKCGQPRNSIRHSGAAATSVDAHEFKPAESGATAQTAPTPEVEAPNSTRSQVISGDADNVY